MVAVDDGMMVELPGNGVGGEEGSDIVGTTPVAASRYTDIQYQLNKL